MTDSKQELKPCPFCGKTPEVTTRDVEPQNDSWYGRKDETFILCDCGACLFEGSFHEGFGASERAIAAWNARPADPLTEARVRDAFDKVAAVNTVTICSLDEMEAIVNRALTGEFDADFAKEGK